MTLLVLASLELVLLRVMGIDDAPTFDDLGFFPLPPPKANDCFLQDLNLGWVRRAMHFRVCIDESAMNKGNNSRPKIQP